MKNWITSVADQVGQTVTIKGWVHARRDMGKIIFFDVRDRSGLVQVVITPEIGEDYERAKGVRDEFVVEIMGEVKARGAKQVNVNIATGKVEILAKTITILNSSETPPYPLHGDTREVNEELRLKYRYLDMRNERLSSNLILRDQVIHTIRETLHHEGFLEIETPILTKGTPEGAREFIVPSRLHPGTFYAMPQSPQQFKQLLMVGGIERYFQIARCFRDEDQRGDRQPEFTQLDMELSFVEQEDVMNLNEQLLIALVAAVAPEKKIQTVPFPCITYKEAMKKYGNDRPDMRENKDDKDLLAFCWVVDFPFFEKTDDGGWTFTHNPFSAAMPEHREWLMDKKKIGDILTTQYDVVLNGFEIGGGSIRNHQPEALRKVFEIMGLDQSTIDDKFGHMMEAFKFGAPPHGGIAWGLDRVIALLANEPNIREVMAFPKTGDARDPMMNAPSVVPQKTLKEMHIKTDV